MPSACSLQAPEAGGEQMLHALREHVEVQLQQRQQSASIRLDPPELGSLEIHLSHESGRLTVQLSAANADVARLLQQTSDRLRQELVAQQFVRSTCRSAPMVAPVAKASRSRGMTTRCRRRRADQRSDGWQWRRSLERPRQGCAGHGLTGSISTTGSELVMSTPRLVLLMLLLNVVTVAGGVGATGCSSRACRR